MGRRRGSPAPRTDVIIAAMQEVGPSIFFSLLVITISFLPVFTLEATEGRLFKPLAFTKTYSIGFASILAVTLTPALAVLFIRGKVRDESRNPINRWLTAAYTPVVRFVFDHRWKVVVAALLAMVLTAPAALRLSSEFMPPLNEGVILYMPTAPPGMSENEASVVLQSMDRELKKFPEVASVFGKMGRAETATDPAPLGMAEVTVVLKPRSRVAARAHVGRPPQGDGRKAPLPRHAQRLVDAHPDADRDARDGREEPPRHRGRTATISRPSRRPRSRSSTRSSSVPGTRSAFAERSTGGFYIDFDVDREAAARHGLSVEDVNSGRGAVHRRRERLRDRRGPRALPDQRPLRARVPRRSRAPRAHAHRHAGRRADPAVAGRERARRPRAADDPQRRAASSWASSSSTPTAPSPTTWPTRSERSRATCSSLPARASSGSGQFKYFERAKERLKWVIPLTLGIVFVLLYFNTKSFVETVIVMLAVPFSLVGAIWLLYLLHYNVSVAVWVGVIALAGLDAETGVVMLLYLTLAYDRHVARRSASGRSRTYARASSRARRSASVRSS